MVANKTRIPVRGTIGKSVPIPAQPHATGVTLAQLMALLAGYLLKGSGTVGTPIGAISPVSATTKITTFTQAGGASQTYTVPVGATVVDVILISGGGGGSSGLHQVTGANQVGGAGGGGGAVSRRRFRASDLGASQTITFSNATTGGNGGAGSTATSGQNSGVAGSNVQFGNLLFAVGAAAGAGGVSAGTGGFGTVFIGTQGGTAPSGAAGNIGTAPTTMTSSLIMDLIYPATGGGGGGGLVNVGPVAKNGGAGGTGAYATPDAYNINGGTAGTVGAGQNGGNGGSAGWIGTGGGGGASSVSAGSAGNGGNGGAFGGGGGGGGSIYGAAGTNTSGAGGNGGAAACICIAW